MAPVEMEAVLPNPVFEGSEKRLEVDFLPIGPAAACGARGLRALTRSQLDELMSLACCTIVSQRSNPYLDAYVLSESSLFVFPTKWVLKTCGTTRLLYSVPRLLEMAAQLGMEPVRCKFTRASFLFPEQQLFPHCCYENEFRYLHRHFGHLDPSGSGQATVIGEEKDGLQWHVYNIESPKAGALMAEAVVQAPPHTFNLEVCMTDLGRKEARQFYRDGGFVSASETTSRTGIADLLPGSIIDDYVFEPCGYSMNGILDATLMTIHVTPEPGHSYASLEMSGCPVAIGDPHRSLSSALRIFNPSRFSLTMSTIYASDSAGCCGALLGAVPEGYHCCAAQLCDLPGGGRLAYYTFVAVPADADEAGMVVEGMAGAGACQLEKRASSVLPPLKMATSASCLSLQSLFMMEEGGDVGNAAMARSGSSATGVTPCGCRCGSSGSSDMTMALCDSEGEVGCASEGDS